MRTRSWKFGKPCPAGALERLVPVQTAHVRRRKGEAATNPLRVPGLENSRSRRQRGLLFSPASLCLRKPSSTSTFSLPSRSEHQFPYRIPYRSSNLINNDDARVTSASIIVSNSTCYEAPSRFVIRRAPQTTGRPTRALRQ